MILESSSSHLLFYRKIGPLTDEEFEIMKTHTTIGYNMCMRNPKLRPYSTGALYHHEALNGSGYPRGIAAPNIPFEGQIIRVADEFDAITSKRQYKTHIGVCDTLNIIISESSPKAGALNALVQESKPDKSKREKYGKVNPRVVKALLKVIIDDTEYEMYNLGLYIDYLKEEIERLKIIEKYFEKYSTSTRKVDIEYYKAGMEQLFEQGETIENHASVLNEYKQAYEAKKEEMAKLNEELKKIKKLKV